METKKEVKYPIKYALMPMKEQTGWEPGLNELERVFDTVAYIAAKCYVISERKEYSSDGTSKTKYEVVFLFEKSNVSYRDDYKPTVPRYNVYSKECYNSIFVDQLFDSFDVASKLADERNEETFHKGLALMFLGEDLESRVAKAKEKHQKTVDKYKKLEELLEKKSADTPVSVGISSSLTDLIERIIDKPSDFYIKLAAVLRPEEREFLRRLIENRSCMNCTNVSCRVEQSEKVGLDELGQPEGSSCVSWDNPELVGRQLVIQQINN